MMTFLNYLIGFAIGWLCGLLYASIVQRHALKVFKKQLMEDLNVKS